MEARPCEGRGEDSRDMTAFLELDQCMIDSIPCCVSRRVIHLIKYLENVGRGRGGVEREEDKEE